MFSPANQINTKLDCAKFGIFSFLKNCPWQTVSVITFTSKCQVLHKFTQNHDSIIKTLNQYKKNSDFDNRNMRSAFLFVEKYVAEKFGQYQVCQIIMITDGKSPEEKAPLSPSSSQTDSYKFQNELWKLHIICLSDIVLNSNKKATCFTIEINHVLQGYKELLNRILPLKITKNHPKGDYILDKGGAFWYLPYPQTNASIENVINVMLDKYYLPRKFTLICGQFTFPIKIYPLIHVLDEEDVQLMSMITIVGFKSKKELFGEPTRYRFGLFLDQDNNNNDDNVNVEKEKMEIENDVDNNKNQNDYFHLLCLENHHKLLSPSSPPSTNQHPKSYLTDNIKLPQPEYIDTLFNRVKKYINNLPNEDDDQQQKVEEVVMTVKGKQPAYFPSLPTSTATKSDNNSNDSGPSSGSREESSSHSSRSKISLSNLLN
ncbi:3401_t:CDS:10 [Entrophospora sp. SA101]|nr:3401_t:CDS:10 [Entrophospora sp. SA101]